MLGIVIILCALTGHQSEYSRDFRKQGFDYEELTLVGVDGPLRVKSESRGVRISLPQGMKNLRPTGFSPIFRISGDFEVTLGYKILDYEKPESGDGVGVSLYAVMDSPNNEAVYLAHKVRVGDRQVVSLSRMSTVAGKRKATFSRYVPVSTMGGKLKLIRKDSTLSYLMAEADSNEFIELHHEEVGTNDVPRLRVAAENGTSPHAVDVLLNDFQVRADGIHYGAPPPTSQSRLYVWPSAIVIMAAILGFLWRNRSSSALRLG